MNGTIQLTFGLPLLIAACSSATAPDPQSTSSAAVTADVSPLTACGALLEPPCTGTGCDTGLHPDPSFDGLCAMCGGSGQTCCGSTCYGAGIVCGGNTNGLTTVDASTCQAACGAPGQPPCQVVSPGGVIAACQAGAVVSGDECVACGGDGDVVCSVSPACGNGANCTSGCDAGLVDSDGTCVVPTPPCVDSTPHGSLWPSAKPIEAQKPFTLTVDWWSGNCQPTPGPVSYVIQTVAGQNWYVFNYNEGWSAMPNPTQVTLNGSNLSTGEELYLNAGEYNVIACAMADDDDCVGIIGQLTVE